MGKKNNDNNILKQPDREDTQNDFGCVNNRFSVDTHFKSKKMYMVIPTILFNYLSRHNK